MKLQLKRSNVLEAGSAKEPTAVQMEYGELAVNYNNGDPALFLKDSNDNIIRIAGSGSIGSGGNPSGPLPPGTGNQVGDLFFDTTNEILLYWNGSEWVPIASNETAADIFVGTLAEIDAAVPATDRRNGFLWWNTEDGTLYVWYKDGNTNQWVIANAGGGSGEDVYTYPGGVTQTVQARLEQYVSVEDFGAVGDGVWSYNSLTGKYSLDGTDDTAAINSAIDCVYNKGSGTVVFDGTKKYKLSDIRDGTQPAMFIKPGVNVDFNGATIAVKDTTGCLVCAPPDYRTLGSIQALISEDVSARGKTFRVYSTGQINVSDELFFRVGDNPYDNRETQHAFFATVTAVSTVVTSQGTSYDVTIDRGLPVSVTIADYGFTATAQTSSDEISISVTTSFQERGIETQDPIYFTTTGSMPSGLDENTPYFATSVTYDASTDEQKFKVSTTPQNALDGVFVTISSAGSGTLQVYRSKNIYAQRFVKAPFNQYIRNLNIECYINDTFNSGDTSVVNGIDMRYSRNIEHSNIQSTGNAIGAALLNYRYCFNVEATNIGLKMAKCRKNNAGAIIPSTGRFANMWNVENIAINNYNVSACQGNFVFIESYAKSVLFKGGQIENSFKNITGASRVNSVIFSANQGSEVHADVTRCTGSGSDFEFTNSGGSNGNPTWSNLEIDFDDRISSLRFDHWTGGSFRDLLPLADGNVIDIHYLDKKRVKHVLHLDRRGTFLPVTESKLVRPPFGAVTGMRLQVIGGDPGSYAEALTIAAVGTSSTKADGNYGPSATTAAASDKGAGLTITYSVSGGVASNFAISDGGSGYEVGDLFVVDNDQGVTGTISTVSNDYVQQWRLNYTGGSEVLRFGASASDITPSNEVIETPTASLYSYGTVSGIDITSASGNSYIYSASHITDPFIYMSVEIDYVPVRISQGADVFTSFDARTVETELWESQTDPSTNADMTPFSWPRGARCRKLQVSAGGHIGWVYVGGATTGWKEFGAIDT
jgi:hypothetical protein